MPHTLALRPWGVGCPVWQPGGWRGAGLAALPFLLLVSAPSAYVVMGWVLVSESHRVAVLDLITVAWFHLRMRFSQ